VLLFGIGARRRRLAPKPPVHAPGSGARASRTACWRARTRPLTGGRRPGAGGGVRLQRRGVEPRGAARPGLAAPRDRLPHGPLPAPGPALPRHRRPLRRAPRRTCGSGRGRVGARVETAYSMAARRSRHSAPRPLPARRPGAVGAARGL
jgi:hypothetical protein